MKSLIAIAAAAVALAGTMGPAEAGFGIRIGIGIPLFHSGPTYAAPSYKKRVHRVERVQRAPVRTIRKPQATAVAAKAPEPVVEPKIEKTVARNENSSIATAKVEKLAQTENSSISIVETPKTAAAAKSVDPVETETETKADGPEIAQNIDCKKFFPSVGMTLSVPCE